MATDHQSLLSKSEAERGREGLADFAPKMKDPNKSFKTSLKKVSELFLIINVVYVYKYLVLWRISNLTEQRKRKKEKRKEGK